MTRPLVALPQTDAAPVAEVVDGFLVTYTGAFKLRNGHVVYPIVLRRGSKSYETRFRLPQSKVAPDAVRLLFLKKVIRLVQLDIGDFA